MLLPPSRRRWPWRCVVVFVFCWPPPHFALERFTSLVNLTFQNTHPPPPPSGKLPAAAGALTSSRCNCVCQPGYAALFTGKPALLRMDPEAENSMHAIPRSLFTQYSRMIYGEDRNGKMTVESPAARLVPRLRKAIRSSMHAGTDDLDLDHPSFGPIKLA